MFSACAILNAMGKMLQVRNIPERLHKELRRRAKARGQTLTDYVQEVLEREVARPPAEEVFDRIESRRPVDLNIRVAEIIRQERADREAS
jgi:plasmid stability protein